MPMAARSKPRMIASRETFARLPCAGAELMNQLQVAEDSTEVDDDSEGDEGHSGPEGDAGGTRGEMRFSGGELAQKERKAADSEANAHEAEAGANPGEEGTLCGGVDTWVLFGWLVGGIHGGNCKG